MASRVQLRPRPGSQHILHFGRAALLLDLGGQVTGEKDGYFVDDTRLLCRDEVLVDGEKLETFSAGPVGPARFLGYLRPPKSAAEHQDLIFELHRSLDGEFCSTLRATNYSLDRTMEFELRWLFAADFVDLNAVLVGSDEEPQAKATASWNATARRLCFGYRYSGISRAAVVEVTESPGEVEWDGEALRSTVSLAPHESASWTVRVGPAFERAAKPVPSHELRRQRAQLASEMPRLTCSNRDIELAWATAVEDLASLPLGLRDGPLATSAGIPMYQHFFGRDTLTTGWQALLATPIILRDALTLNAAWIGREVDDWRDEEPGKLIHQARWGPLSELGIDPVWRYFGDYAAAPDFVAMLGQYYAWTADSELTRSLLPTARAALTWMERLGDIDNDGFMEYVARSAKGVKNQGWKDSGDAVIDEQGRLIENPVATSELQAYWYAALQQAALLFGRFGDYGYSYDLLRKAATLKRRFNDAFWLEERGHYAAWLGPDKRPVAIAGSNDAHLLATAIVPVERAPRLIARLFEPDLYSGWGLRTLSSLHPSYHPFSYHRGSVWPVENGTFAFGLARYGAWEELGRLCESVFATAALFDGHRLPETIGGIQRDEAHDHPGVYPQSNAPQSWSASMIVTVVQAMLAMNAIAPLGVVLLDPHLPPGVSWLRLENLRVGGTTFDLDAWQTDRGTTDFRVQRRAGRVRFVRQAPPQARTNAAGRAWSALRSIA